MTYGVTIGAFLTPTALATVLHDAWGDTLLTRQIATCSLEKTRVKFGPNATGPFAEYTEIRSGPRNEDAEAPVSYTHLTLPTKRIV